MTLFLSRSHGLSPHHLPMEKRVRLPPATCALPLHGPVASLRHAAPSSRKGFVPLLLEEQGSVGCTYRLSLCPLTVCHLVAPWHFRAGLWGTHMWLSCP